MKDKFTLAWSFRNRKEVLFESIRTADKTCPKDVDFCLVDASSDEDTIRSLREFCNKIKNRRIRICESTYRSSLSEAWNLCMMLTENRYVIFASSDVVFKKKEWFDVIRSVSAASQYILLSNHAVFCLDKKAIPSMGWFDEKFHAGPHFDPDLMIRASEAGIHVINAGNHGYFVHGDEEDKDIAKQRQEDEVKDRLPMHDFYNENYFKKKWRTSWPGWSEAISQGKIHLPHPPTHISQVVRAEEEVDPHPRYTEKYK